jgi:hypothetical protein
MDRTSCCVPRLVVGLRKLLDGVCVYAVGEVARDELHTLRALLRANCSGLASYFTRFWE